MLILLILLLLIFGGGGGYWFASADRQVDLTPIPVYFAICLWTWASRLSSSITCGVSPHGCRRFSPTTRKCRLIAVIVSGYDGDGAAALCGIRDAGGVTIAQKPETAGQAEMPCSAIASGCIDLILSPEEIAREIVRIAQASSAR